MKYEFCNTTVVLSLDSLSVYLQGEVESWGWFGGLSQKGEHTSQLRPDVLVNWGAGSCEFRDPSDHL